METIHLQQVLPHEIEKRSFEIIEQELIERGELREDADDLAPLGILQFAQFVVDLDDLDRLDIEGAARGRLVMDEAVELAFVRGRDGDHGTTVADRDLRVGLDDAGPLGGREDRLQALGCLTLAFADGAAHPL